MIFMKYVSLIIIIAFLMPGLPVFSKPVTVLKWQLDKNERIELVKTAEIKYLVNSNPEKIYEERNIIDLTCVEKSEDTYHLQGVFSVFDRESGQSVFNLRERHESGFKIDSSGRMDIPEKFYMPNLRNIPTFPERELKEGDTWDAPGELIIDNYSRPFKMIFDVEYRLENINTGKDKNTANISFEYFIDNILTDPSLPADFPLRITGYNKGKILWDIDSNRMLSSEDNYRIIFFHPTGPEEIAALEFQMNIDTKADLFKPVSRREQELEKEKLRKDIPEDDNLEVDTHEQGLVIRMGDLLFDFDSYDLRPDTKKRLDEISKAIQNRYPDREIIVEGYTDNTGDRDYNYQLSEKRADSVAGYLKEKSGHDKFSFRGFGPDKPIGDNTTEEGRQRNRRVEIIIKMN